MARKLMTTAAQMGPITKSETRADAVHRLFGMMREAKGRGCDLVVFTEQAMDSLTLFHNHLSMQAEAYQNATWVLGTAKCGHEKGSKMGGKSVIIAPSGEIVAQAVTVEDEVITASCDLDIGKRYKETVFDFAAHRRPEHYGLIVARTGAIPPS